MDIDYSRQIGALYPELMVYARYLCRNEDEAADLRGETVCRVLEHIGLYDPGKNSLKGFCKVVMHNLYVVGYNRNRLWQRFISCHHEGTAAAADVAHDYHLIRQECRWPEVTMLADGYTCEEIAAAQGIPSGTVRTRIHCERKRLAGILDYSMSTAKPRKRKGRPPKKKVCT